MMPGCSSLAEVRASRWNRSTNSLSNASENGSTLMATSRSSCFSRALKTIAMPPRPSSSRISYSSLSCDRTSSSSVSSWWSWIGVAARSKPQERQNLLASSFWVPQREQDIVLRGVAEGYGRVGREPVNVVIELGRAPLGETAERVEGHRVGPGGPHEPRALTAEHEVARREARAIQHADGDGVARHEVARVAAPFFDQEAVP